MELEKVLHQRGRLCYRLDGDNIRLGLNKDLGFTEQDRAENIRRIGEVAKLFSDAGVLVLCSFVSPYCRDRDSIRLLHEEAGIPFLEIFVDCSLAAAEARDPKGLYKKARAGEIPLFTGISDPYEPPTRPNLRLQSETTSLEEEVNIIVDKLLELELIPLL